MSRIGKKPVDIPQGVKVAVAGTSVRVEGPKGKLEWSANPAIAVRIDGNKVVCARSGESRLEKALHGLVRATINNMVTGVVKPFERGLDINGVGFNAKVQGKDLILQVGFSHPVKMPIPEGLTVACPSLTKIHVSGADKHAVGQFAANVRFVRPVEPYQLKGIKYSDEIIKKKQGKTFVSGA